MMAIGLYRVYVYLLFLVFIIFGIFGQYVDVIWKERIDPVDPVVIVCEDEVHSICQNSPVRNSGYGNQGTGIDSSVALYNVYNVIVEVRKTVQTIRLYLQEDVVIAFSSVNPQFLFKSMNWFLSWNSYRPKFPVLFSKSVNALNLS